MTLVWIALVSAALGSAAYVLAGWWGVAAAIVISLVLSRIA